jgi:hypothetical protein
LTVETKFVFVVALGVTLAPVGRPEVNVDTALDLDPWELIAKLKEAGTRAWMTVGFVDAGRHLKGAALTSRMMKSIGTFTELLVGLSTMT